MQNIILTTRLTAFGCLSLMLAGYSLWINDNIHQKFSLEDILLNNKFKTDPFVDYHDYFPTEEDIANNIVNDNFINEIAHHDNIQHMVEMVDHYDELFEASSFVTIEPLPPKIEVTYKIEDIAPTYTLPKRSSAQDFMMSKNDNNSLIALEHNDTPQKTTQAIILPVPIIEAPPPIEVEKPSGLSAIEQAIQDLSRNNSKSDPFYTPRPQRHKVKPLNKENSTVKTNYLSLYKPQTDLDDSFILPISDALRVSKSDQTQKRDNFKKDIANIYDKRRVQTLKARDYNKSIGHNIAEINKILKQMGVSIEKKFYAHKHDISKHSILNDMLASKEDLIFRFPTLYSSLQKAQALKIALSFVPTASPVRSGRMSSNFGWRKDPFHKKSRFHSGIDFASPSGTPIYSPASGTVKFAGRKGGYGNTIEIYHGNGITTRYAHLSRINVKKGQKIIQFSKIGAVGSTGRSTGPHLHYEIMRGNKKVNPKIFTNKNKKIVNIIKVLK